jgi:WD40 repeat protein
MAGRPATACKPATEKDVQVRVLEGHKSAVNCLAMPANGRFALTSGDDGVVRRWGLGAGNESSEIPLMESSRAIAVTADGSHAAVGGNEGSIYVIDLSSARLVQKWQGHDGSVLRA